MSEFSKCLNCIKEKKDVTAATMAQLIDVDVSVVYRWITGERFPNGYEKIKQLIEKMKLSKSEASELREAYEITLLGDENFHSFRKVKELFEVLQKRKSEYLIHMTSHPFMGIYQNCELPDEMVFNNNLEVVQCFQGVFDYLQIQDEKNVYIKLQRNIPEINILIKMFLAKVENAYVEEVVCVPDDVGNLSLYYLDMLKSAIDIIAQKNDVRVYYGDKKGHMMGTAGNYIISDDFMVQFDDEMSFGMMTTDKAAINFAKNNHRTLKETCFVLYNKSENPMEYVERNIARNKVDLCGVEYMPCMGLVIPEEVLQECLYDFPEKQEIIQIMKNMYDRVVGNIHDEIMDAVKAVTFFTGKGLIQFMETGRFEVFPYEIYNAVDVASRCKVLRNAIDIMKNGIVTQYMLKEECGIDCQGIHIEYDNVVKKLYIETHFDMKNSEVLEISEENLCNRFNDFFAYLQKSDDVYTYEETVQYMEDVFSRYKAKL